MVIGIDEQLQVRFELLVALEVVAFDGGLFERLVHPLDLVNGPRMIGLRQATLDVVVPANAVEQMHPKPGVGPDRWRGE